jgi:protein Tex
MLLSQHTGLGFTVVSEAGASVWSVSPAAAAEFPSVHCSQLGAVSIGRRLLDPLSELVKVEPAALGAHQYTPVHITVSLATVATTTQLYGHVSVWFVQ